MPRNNISQFMSCAALVCGLLLLSTLSTTVRAEEGSIGGVIRSGGEVVGAHRIMLIRFGPDNDVQRTPGETNAEGEFLFENLSTGGSFTYFVGIRYQDQLHRSEPISLQDSPHRADLVLNLDDPSAQALPAQPVAPTLQVMSHLMVIVKRNEQLEVREILKIVNRGTTAFAGSGDADSGSPHGSFHLSLPKGYDELQGIEGLDPSLIRQHATGLVYTAPLEPGEHNLMFTYALPLQGKVMVILPRRTLPTDVLDVLVEEESLAATSDLSFAGRVSVEPHVFTHFRGIDLPDRSRSWLQLAQRTTALPALRVGVYGLVVVLSLTGMAAPYARGRRAKPISAPQLQATPQQIHDLRAAEQLLLQRISQIDRRWEAGAIDDMDYHPRRRDYKTQLCSLLRQLQQIGEHQNQRV